MKSIPLVIIAGIALAACTSTPPSKVSTPFGSFETDGSAPPPGEIIARDKETIAFKALACQTRMETLGRDPCICLEFDTRYMMFPTLFAACLDGGTKVEVAQCPPERECPDCECPEPEPYEVTWRDAYNKVQDDCGIGGWRVSKEGTWVLLNVPSCEFGNAVRRNKQNLRLPEQSQ